jgi:predicted transcriptional regulator
MTENVKLSDQQFNIMEVLWHHKEASAKTVQRQLKGAPLAHTTIATILTRLEKRGILSSRTEGRERVFTPLISEQDAKRSMISSLVSTLFKGDDSKLLAHLVKENEFNQDDLEEIKSMIEGSKQ